MAGIRNQTRETDYLPALQTPHFPFQKIDNGADAAQIRMARPIIGDLTPQNVQLLRYSRDLGFNGPSGPTRRRLFQQSGLLFQDADERA